jgi:hypothetical protein
MASRAKAAGRAVVKGLGGTLLAGGVGAIGYGIHGIAAKITAPGGDMSKYPGRGWIPGVAMLVAGHMLKRRPRLTTAAIALQGAAGFSLAEYGTLAYIIKQNAANQPPSGAQAGTSGVGAVMGPADLQDTGALLTGYEVEAAGYADYDPMYAAAMSM